MNPRLLPLVLTCVTAAGLMPSHSARSAVNETDASTSTPPSKAEAERLPEVTVSGTSTAVEMPGFPASVSGVDAARIEATINRVDVEDAVKYLPSLFVRKRNFGDTQAVLATRSWGVNSSARTLVYVDDLPISALIANNNTLGAPRWGVVAPDQVERVDMLYGPFSAAYPGNAMGGVLRITTRTPEQTEIRFKQTQAWQSFDLYRTDENLHTSQTSASAAGRHGAWHWFVGANLQDSASNPLSFITGATIPTGTHGAIDANNKLGNPANVFGAGGLLRSRMSTLHANLAVDLAPGLRASYLAGYWTNDARSRAQSYLLDADGQPTWGNVAGFASNTYRLDAAHLLQGLSLKSNGSGDWDVEAILTHYEFLRDRQLSPAGVGEGIAFTPNGRRADLGGTGWTTLDLKSVWRPAGAHELAFGLHADRYDLKNPTRNTAAWQDPATVGSL